MFTKHNPLGRANPTTHTRKETSLTMKVNARLPASLSTVGSSSTTPFQHLSGKISAFCSSALLIALTAFSSVHADTHVTRWYRYYDSRGIPTISSTVSEQHLQQGYDVLDGNMLLIHHYPPFSSDKYAQQQVIREQAIAKRISDRHLQETYISSDRAATQRDRELSDIDGQIKRGEQQSAHLSSALNDSITIAANYERQNKSIPSPIKAQLEKNKSLLAQSEANVAALKAKREQTNKQFNDAITELKSIEQQSNKPNIAATP